MQNVSHTTRLLFRCSPRAQLFRYVPCPLPAHPWEPLRLSVAENVRFCSDRELNAWRIRATFCAGVGHTVSVVSVPWFCCTNRYFPVHADLVLFVSLPPPFLLLTKNYPGQTLNTTGETFSGPFWMKITERSAICQRGDGPTDPMGTMLQTRGRWSSAYGMQHEYHHLKYNIAQTRTHYPGNAHAYRVRGVVVPTTCSICRK